MITHILDKTLYQPVLAGMTLAVCLAAIPSRAAALEFWHPWPHAAKTVNSLAAQYSKDTGVVVRVRVFNPGSYRPWSAKQKPDLVGLYRPTKRGIEDLARAGRVYNLQSEMSRGWYATLWPGLLETFSIRSGGQTKIYGVPLTGFVNLFVYNRNLFRKAGIANPPRTWSELMSDSQRLRRIGVTPYAGGFSSDMPPLAAVYEQSYLGIHKLTQTYYGHYPYTAPDWIRNLGLYPEMRRYGFTTATSAKTSVATATKALLDGRVAMVFTDASFESIRAAYKPRFSLWAVFSAPVDRRAPFLPRLPGGVVEGVVVNSKSSRKTQAIAFARWLTGYQQQITLANGASSIPANSAASFSTGLRSHLRTFASTGMRDQAIDLRIYESPRVLKTFYSGVRGLIAGSGTPTSVAKKTQVAKKR